MVFKYLLPELVISLTAVLLLTLRVLGLRHNARRSGLLATLGLIAAGVVLWPIAEENVALLGGAFHLDTLAVYFKYLFLLSGVLVVMGSLEFVEERIEPSTEFFVTILFATLGLFLMASAGEFISLFLALELSVVCFFILTAMSKSERGALEAALKYVILGGFSAALLLYGMSLVYGATGTTNFEGIGRALYGQVAAPAVLLAGLFLVSGLGFKVAAVPFHFWAPDVYQGAPTPVTAYLAVASKAAGFAVLVRVFLTSLGSQALGWSSVFTVVALTTMVYGNLAAIPQTDVKRLLAYSSIAQSGYLLLGLAAMTPAGITALLFYAMLYTVSNLAAFLVLIAVERATGGTTLEDFAGLSRRAPGLAAAMLVALLSLGGIPPLAGFIGKFFLFASVVQRGKVWLALIAVLTSVASVYYYLGVAKRMYVDPPKSDEPIKGSVLTTATLVVSLGATIIFGVYPQPLINLAELMTRVFLG